MRQVDLAIVGAGPAGSAAALAARAANPDLDILLIDRADFPRDKACGDGIGPECAVALAALGVEHVLADVPPVTRVEVRAPDGAEVAGTVPRPGYVLPRLELDARLQAAAVAAGVETVHHNVRSVEPDGEGVVVDELCRARWVIGADGANSNVRRASGTSPGDPPMGLAMRGYGTGPPLDALLIRFVSEGWPAYAWAFPIGGGAVNVGYGTFDRSAVRGRDQLVVAVSRFLPEYEVDPATLRAHHLPLASVPPALGAGRILLAGDAANLVHPLTGEGITYALVSGRLAGAAVAQWSGNGGPHPGRAYEATLRAELGRHLRHLRFAARLFRHRTPVNLSVAAARHDPRMLGALAEFSLGIGLITPSLSWALTKAWARRTRS